MPASAHASLLSTEPSPDGVYASSPSAITLRFSEPVEVTLGGVRVFDAKTEKRVDNGPAEHPNGDGTYVTSDLPKLGNGTYVVTWRVVSQDSHPIEGAFTFQVGPKASVSNAQGVATTLPRPARVLQQSASSTVPASHPLRALAAHRWRRSSCSCGRAAAPTCCSQGIVLGGWLAAVVATIVGIAPEGVYGVQLGLSKVFDRCVRRRDRHPLRAHRPRADRTSCVRPPPVGRVRPCG
ncbi:MAG: copper resistance protein CopC [Acidimicrobiia bacterium]